MAEPKPITRHSLAQDVLLLVLANICWGTTDVVAKLALQEMSPEALIWLRLTIALLAFAPALISRRREIPKSLRGLMPFVALGLCGFVLDFVFVYQGLKLTAASHATAFRISESLIILLLAAMILREKVGPTAVLGLVTGMAGVFLVIGIDFKELSLFASGSRLGDLLIISGIFVEGLYTIIGKKVLKNISPLAATGLALFFGWLVMSVVFGARVGAEFLAKPPALSGLLASAYLGLAATALGFWLYYDVLSRRDSHRVGISIMIQPVIGIPLAAMVFHDPITPGFLAGTALIALGVFIAFRKVSVENPVPG